MPRIPDYFLECVVYLYPSEAAAEDGEKIGGTGFLVGIPVGPDDKGYLLFVVTNKHVISNGNMVVRLNTRDGQTDIIALDGEHWYNHPAGDDLSVCPIGLNSTHHKVDFIRPNQWVNKDWIKETDIGPGDDVFIVGRFISREGKQKNTPTVRFGCIAQMPDEPIVCDDGFKQECFLAEIRSISGYSGAPVFVRFTKHVAIGRMKKYPNAGLILQGFGFLLGIDFCHIYSRDKIINVATKQPVSQDWFVPSNTGMAGVIPAWKLAEIFERNDVKKMIDDAKKRRGEFLEKEATQASLDVSQDLPAPTDANPNHLEDFTRLANAAARKQKPDA